MEQGWTQKQLGDKSGGVNKATVVFVEDGGNSKRETFEKIASGLGLSLAQLYALVPGEQETELTAPVVAGGGFRKDKDTADARPSKHRPTGTS